MKDRIEREIDIPAPIARVWRAITDPDEVSQWFGDVAEIDLRAGGDAVFGWTEHNARSRARIESVDAPHYFAYRWAVDDDTSLDDSPSTLVEFRLTEHNGGTRLQLVESGFADLPADRRQQALEGNESGWKSELAELAEFVEPARL